jgi:acetolactate synthase-1/3 small subunit
MTAPSTTPTTPTDDGAGEGGRHHLVVVRVENKAGVLARIAGLFSRRGFNIFSLAVAPTHDPRFSRISIVVDLESTRLDQVLAQLEKLVNVVEIRELRPADATEAELCLVTVRAALARAALEAALAAAGARVVEEAGDTVTARLAGAPAELDAFEAALARFEIVELQRTGRVALPKLAPALRAPA